MSHTNKFPGTCARCGERVEANAGELRLEAKGWQVYCPRPCEAKPKVSVSPPRAQVGDLSAIMALFRTARQHLKFPAIELDVPAVQGLSIRVNVAGDRAREPGSLTVVDSERAGFTGNRDWLGRVSLDGTWQPSGKTPHADAIGARLREFAADPAKVAGEHGRLHGRCCFCRISLKDERSTAVGYGKTCAENFGLPWGTRPAEFAGRAA